MVVSPADRDWSECWSGDALRIDLKVVDGRRVCPRCGKGVLKKTHYSPISDETVFRCVSCGMRWVEDGEQEDVVKTHPGGI